MVDARRYRFHRCSQLRCNRKNSENGVAPSLRRPLFVICPVAWRRQSAGRHFVRGGSVRQRCFVIERCSKPSFCGEARNATPEALRPLPLTSLFWPAVRPEVLPKLSARRDRDGYGLPWAKAARRIRSKPSPERTACPTREAHAAEAVRVRRPYGCRANAQAPSLPDKDRGPSGSGCTRAVWATPDRVCGARRPAGPAFLTSPRAGDG